MRKMFNLFIFFSINICRMLHFRNFDCYKVSRFWPVSMRIQAMLHFIFIPNIFCTTWIFTIRLIRKWENKYIQKQNRLIFERKQNIFFFILPLNDIFLWFYKTSLPWMLLRAVKKSLNNLIRVSKETVNSGQASINSRLKRNN